METKQKNRHQANHVPRHKASHSTTLMRKAVRKPKPSLKRQISLSKPLVSPYDSIVLSTEGTTNISSKRTISSIKKSPKISHFSKVSYHSLPELKPLSSNSYSSAQPLSVHHSDKSSKSSLELLLEKGIADASSHLEPPHKYKKRRSKLHLGFLK